MDTTIDQAKVRRIAAEVLEELKRQQPEAFPVWRGGPDGARADWEQDRPAWSPNAGGPTHSERPVSTETSARAGGGSRPGVGTPLPDPRSGIAPPPHRPPWSATGATLRPEEMGVSPDGRPTVTCNVSARHIHVTKEHLEILFGKDAELTKRNELMQPGQFASHQTVSVIAGRGRVIEAVRILGPTRRYTQVELARTDCVYLGIRTAVRNSGDHEGTAGGTLVGPNGTLILSQGVIIADRHIHTPPEIARQLGLEDNQFIRVRVFHTEKPTILERVRIRIDPDFAWEMHLDTDDANACGVANGDRLELLLD